MTFGDTAARNRSLRSMGLYLTVAFAMAWAFWLVGWLITQNKLSLPLFPILVGGSFGSFVGALVATLAAGGPRRALRFFARAFDPRMGCRPDHRLCRCALGRRATPFALGRRDGGS
jgi:hypothetical protein